MEHLLGTSEELRGNYGAPLGKISEALWAIYGTLFRDTFGTLEDLLVGYEILLAQ